MLNFDELQELKIVIDQLEKNQSIQSSDASSASEAAKKLIATLRAQTHFDQQDQEVENQINIGSVTINSESELFSTVTPNTQYHSYLLWLKNQTENVPLHSMDKSQNNPNLVRSQRPKLSRIYVKLKTRTFVDIETTFADNLWSEWLDENWRLDQTPARRPALSVLNAVSSNTNVMLLGPPGSGKSIFIRHLAHCIASAQIEGLGEWIDHLIGWEVDDWQLFPIRITLRDFARWLPDDIRHGDLELFWKYVNHVFQTLGHQSLINSAKNSFYEGKSIVLFDGLDEVYSASQRNIVEDMTLAISTVSESRIVVTTRPSSELKIDNWIESGFSKFEIASFDEDQVLEYVEFWHRSMVDTGVVTPQDAIELESRLRQALYRPDIWPMASNPLLLSTMAFVHTNEGFLSNTRAVLYKDCVELFLYHWEQLKLPKALSSQPQSIKILLNEVGLTEIDFLNVLQRIAYSLHQTKYDHSNSPTIPKDDLVKIFKDACQINKNMSSGQAWIWGEKMVNCIQERAGLLVEHEVGLFSFAHTTFQEYLAGCHLANMESYHLKTKDVLLVDHWAEVVRLSVGYLAHVTGDISKPLNLINENIPEKITDFSNWRLILFLSELILEIGVARTQKMKLGRDLIDKLRRMLVGILETAIVPSAERLGLGKTMSRIGDMRFSTNYFYLPTTFRNSHEKLLGFVYVDRGTFVMYEGTEDACEVELEPYYIARYPVTEVQYYQFILETNSIVPLHWSNGKPDRSRLNCPIVGVSWYDANLYCNWLTKKLQNQSTTTPRLGNLARLTDCIVRLPNEAQWEKAARNKSIDYIYPWGQKFDAAFANTKELEWNEPSAVGLFPEGASPYSIFDMAGNVLEWCTTRYWDHNKDVFVRNYMDSDGREDLSRNDGIPRILRGGSFRHEQRLASNGHRIRNFPVDRHPYFGFRLVLGEKNPNGDS